MVCANDPTVIASTPTALSAKGDAHFQRRIVLIRAFTTSSGGWLAASGL